MTSIGWKKFNFFDEERRTDAPFPEGVTTACSGIDDDIWLGCSDGLLVCLDKDLAIKVTFPGFKGTVHHVHIAPSPQARLFCLLTLHHHRQNHNHHLIHNTTTTHQYAE